MAAVVSRTMTSRGSLILGTGQLLTAMWKGWPSHTVAFMLFFGMLVADQGIVDNILEDRMHNLVG